jgi:hypothetical protein
MAISALATLLPTGVHHPGGLERQQAGLVDQHAALAMRSRVTPCSASGLPKATRATESALAHQLQRALGQADQAHAVVDAARAQAALGDLEAAAFAQQDVGDRHAHVLEAALACGRAARRRSRTPAAGAPW